MGGLLCGPRVTGKAKKGHDLDDGQMKGLTALYGQDAALLQAMSARQLLRDQAKQLVEASEKFVKELDAATAASEKFGTRLAKLADKHVTTGLAALPKEAHTPELAAVEEVCQVVKTLGSTEQQSAKTETAGFGQVVLPRLKKVRNTLERDNSVLVESAEDAYEAAFDRLTGPKLRLEALRQLAPEKQAEDKTEKLGHQLEVEVAQLQAQVEAAAGLLKEKTIAFLHKHTPEVRRAVVAFVVAQHDAYVDSASVLARMVTDAGGGLEQMRSESAHILLPESVPASDGAGPSKGKKK